MPHTDRIDYNRGITAMIRNPTLTPAAAYSRAAVGADFLRGCDIGVSYGRRVTVPDGATPVVAS
mgnify:CR=1 FL=1